MRNSTLATLLPLNCKKLFNLVLLLSLICFSNAGNSQVVVAGWDVNGLTAYGTSPLNASTAGTGVTVVGLTRGSGLTTSGTAASNAWGSTGYDVVASAAAAITNNDFWTFKITADANFKVSLSSISAYNIRRTAAGPSTGQWQYQIGAGAFNDIGTPITWGATTSAGGNAQAAITLSGISALQDVPAGTGITFRIVGFNSTGTTGTNYFNNFQTGNDLIVNGTITAVASTYAVIYNGNTNTGGAAPSDPGSPYTAGTDVTVLGNTGSLVKTGYTFNGWNTAADGSGTAYTAGATITAIAAATTLYAQWTINTYTVLYNGNGSDGGTAPSDPSSPYNFGTNVTVLNEGTLTKTSYTFTGWNTAADGSGITYLGGGTITAIAANTTLFAQWVLANTYAVTYLGNGNTSGAPPSDPGSPYAGGSNVTVLGAGALLKTGYTFSGWNTVAGGGGTAYSAGGTITSIAANTILYAQWTINTYTVTYDGNGNTGGSAPVDGSSPYNFGSNVTVLGVGSLVRTNYNFTGWNTAADGSGTPYASGATITAIASNTTLFAQWTIVTYTVTYNGNTSTGGTAPVDPGSPYAATSNVTVLTAGTLVKTGYSFTGWNTAADGSGAPYSAGGTISNILANTDLFAQWSINSYTVTYDGNGNTGGTAPVDGSSPYTFGATVTVLANTGSLTKTGALFTGWATAADGTGTFYAATGSATFVLGAANVILYAKWSVPLYENFNYTAGGNVGSNSTATSGGNSNNWTTHSNTSGNSGTINVLAGNLNYTGLLASTGNKINVPGSNTTVPRDINRPAGLAGGNNTLYYSFLLNVTDATQLSASATFFNSGGNGYFIHLINGSGAAPGNIFFGRVSIRSVNTGANFRLGISDFGTVFTDNGTDLAFGTTHLVVIKYVYNPGGADVASLWVDPVSIGSTEPAGSVSNSASAGNATTTLLYNSAITGIGIRNSSNTPKADIDEIRAGTTWASVTPPVTHQLTVTAGTGGTITAPASSPATVNEGDATTITASADPGFNFNGWTIESGTPSIANAALASTTVTLSSGDAAVKANFVASNFTITATAQTTGGSISPSGDVLVTPGGSQAFTITTDACNDIADLVLDGAVSVLGDMVGNTYTMTNVTANHTLDVYFNPSTSTTWTGAVNTNWDNAGNWTSCLPSETLDVIIPVTGTQPVLNVDAAVNSITINDGASISLNGKTLTINGGLTSSAAATIIGSDASSLVLNSTNTITSAGTLRLHSLTVNGGTATLASNVEITGGTATILPGEVTVQAGSQLESNGFLTIKSNIFGTGRVAAGDDAGNYITGNVTVERYIPANGFRSWRLLAVPTFGASQTFRQAWQEGVANPLPLQNNLPGFGAQITGTGSVATAQANGFDNTAAQPSLLSWTGTAWAGVSSTNSALQTKKGYFLYLRGDRSQGVTGSSTSATATTLRTKGQLYQGTQLLPAFPANSFNLVGNLYASAIDFQQLGRTGGVSNLFYIWDSKKLNGVSLGAYQTFSGTNGFLCLLGGGSYTLNQPNTKIESGQAFFVQTGGSGGTITLTEGSKLGNGANLGFRPVNPASLVKIDTRLYSTNSTGIVDANVVVFDNSYSNEVAGEDAIKLANATENFGIQKGANIIAIEGRKMISDAETIRFNMSNLKQQEYTLEIAPQNLATQGLEATLEDSYLKTSTAISMETATTVKFTVDANAESSSANRFTIAFKKAAVLPVVDVKPAFVISPNPVEGGMVNLQFKNQPKGNYQVRIISNNGQAVLSSKIAHAGGSATQLLNLPAQITSGMYRVEIIAADKTTTTQSLLVK